MGSVKLSENGPGWCRCVAEGKSTKGSLVGVCGRGRGIRKIFLLLASEIFTMERFGPTSPLSLSILGCG